MYETYGQDNAPAVLIFLHGASGPSAYGMEARKFVACGRSVVLLHYFDATVNHDPSDSNYEQWVDAVGQLIDVLRKEAPNPERQIGIVGVSLGASIALAAGSRLSNVNAIVDWYGSLPDYYYHHLRALPPLLILHGVQDTTIPVRNAEQLQQLCIQEKFICKSHLYPRQGHGFTGDDLRDAETRTTAFLEHYGVGRCKEHDGERSQQ